MVVDLKQHRVIGESAELVTSKNSLIERNQPSSFSQYLVNSSLPFLLLILAPPFTLAAS